jgi:hypothetical protein
LGLAAVFGLVAFAAACGGSEAAAPPPRILEATAERVVVDGAATLSSIVTIRFNRPVSLSDATGRGLPPASIDPPAAVDTGFSVPEIAVVSLEESSTSSRLLTVTTVGLVPDGARVRIAASALVNGGDVAHELAIESDLSPIEAILGSTSVAFATPDIFDPPEPALPTTADRDNDVIRAQLVEHLSLRIALGSEVTQDVLDAYDSIPRDIVPHPKIRAALAAMVGTFAQPAVTSFLTSENCTGSPAASIDFRVPPSSPTLLAEMTRDAAGRRVVSLNPIVETDRFEHLMPLLAHEAIHCDKSNSIEEEIASAAFDTYLYMVLIALDPSLAKANTALARNLNIDALAMANSGRLVPESVGVLQSVGVERAVPDGTSTARSFAEHVGSAYDSLGFESQAPERTASEYVLRLLPLTDMPAGQAFELEYLDALLGNALPDAVMFEAIIALGLVPR